MGFESLMVCIEKIINSLVLLIASVKIDIYIYREREGETERDREVLLTATYKVCIKISPVLISEHARANHNKEVNFIISCRSPSPPSQMAMPVPSGASKT